MPLLNVQNLQSFFQTGTEPCRVVDGVSFTLDAGETLGLVGESGSGKSLTALSIMQLLPKPGYHAGGELMFGNQDLLSLDSAGRRSIRGKNIAMIFQEPMTSLNPVLTVRTQLTEAIRRNTPDGKISRDEQLRQAVEALRLAEIPAPEQRVNEYPHQLSGGMRQRVMIAMALACRPKMLIADEPTTALDVTVQAKILDLLRDLQKRLGTAILFITHDLAVIAQVADRVAVMYAGKIVETAPVDEIFKNPAHPYTERLLECRPRRELRGKTLETITGIVPSPKDYAPGCRFCDRCPHVFEPCHDIQPEQIEIAPGHQVTCHLHKKGRAALAVIQTDSHEEIPDAEAADHDLVLDARQVSKHFAVRKGLFKRVVGRVKAVDDVDLRIRRGTTVALVGESGCGKTTLGRTLTRLYSPTAGRILFQGRDIMRLNESEMHGVRRGMQMLFQDPYSSLNPRMTVRQIVEEGLRAHAIGNTPAERNERLVGILQHVGLKAGDLDAYPHEFSGGQRQRIGIARALAVEPDFLILDEPTSALDMSIQAQILNLLRAIQGQGRQRLTYLFITHDLGVVEYVADEVAVMYLGRIVERNKTVELFDNPRHPYTRALLSSIPKAGPVSDRITLEGDVPSPLNPPNGCHFHPRCACAMPICKELYPAETPTGDDAIVRCHLELTTPPAARDIENTGP
jgi:peptide/nickel transport system ATP-binding protein